MSLQIAFNGAALVCVTISSNDCVLNCILQILVEFAVQYTIHQKEPRFVIRGDKIGT